VGEHRREAQVAVLIGFYSIAATQR